jgi:hypothetical protein
MNKFRKLGYINYNGKLEIHKSLLNFVLHEQPRLQKKKNGVRVPKELGL